MSIIDLTTYDDPNEEKGQDVQVNFTDEEKALIQQYKEKINLQSTTDIIQYGTASQVKVSNFANEILKQVGTKDMRGAGNILLNLRYYVQTFDEKLNKKPLMPFFGSVEKKIQRP